jgi:hypothetical protein
MFEPSNYSYGADYSQLATSALQIGGSLASQAIAQSGHHSGKAKHKAKMEEIAAETPDHSPMWPIAIGIVVAGGIAYYAYTRKGA